MNAQRLAHSRALLTLQDAGVPVLVGGAYAMFHYTGLIRYTKDLDLFLRPSDDQRARAVLDHAGYRTHVEDPVWLSKAFWGASFVDLIYSFGNGVAAVDDRWFQHAPEGEALGVKALIVPAEEMIWSKAYVQERERWDGADVAHLLRVCGHSLDWDRLLERFGSHSQVLLAHLILFSFSYPGDRGVIPRRVWRKLLREAGQLQVEASRICRGTLLSRCQYEADIALWGYQDARERESPGFAAAARASEAPRYAAADEGDGPAA